MPITDQPTHYCEAAVRVRTGDGFFRPGSRPSRDLGVLLARQLVAEGAVRVLDLMAGCGIRSARYGIEAGVAEVWANDADPDRLPLLKENLAPLGSTASVTSLTAQRLLAGCLLEQRRFELLDLDAFGAPTALLPLALEAVAFGGVLYLASTDGRSPTGHDRVAAIRSLGAAARAHPASWELALRLQLGTIARAAWALGRGLEPLFSFSEGRTFRTAVRLRRQPAPGEEQLLGLLAHCHRCGDQQVQSLLTLRGWRSCGCVDQPLAVSGPLWIGPLQHPASLGALEAEASQSSSLGEQGARLLRNLRADPGSEACCWPLAVIARRLGSGPPRSQALVEALRADGWRAGVSGVMAAQLRTDAPWNRVLDLARQLVNKPADPADGTLDR